jgi:hypothetical protein
MPTFFALSAALAARHWLLCLCAVLLICGPALAQEHGGILPDGLMDRLKETRDSIDRNAHESKRWNDFVERWEARFDKWDGSRLAAIFQPLWLIITGTYRLAWGLIMAVIAVCIARAGREIVDAIKAWRGT